MENKTKSARRGSAYAIFDIDPLLQGFRGDIGLRMRNYANMKKRLIGDGAQSLSAYANGHMYFGFHRAGKGWVYREWAPNADMICLFGDFNGWNRLSHPLRDIGGGVWEIQVDGELPHGSKVRIIIDTAEGPLERIPLYCTRAVQDPASLAFDGQIWSPPEAFAWTDGGFARDGSEPLLIYEAHVGMSGEKAGIASYSEFAENILPRVKRLGYNTIQLMAVMEHPYYGSFGYQISNFFAASSRFGTPDELKALVDKAHSMGIAVLLDLVHSHAASNENEGIARFDGTVFQFFHEGAKGDHPQWGSKLFNYGNPSVIHYLLSNLKFWLEEYHLDGFRFDGVTSMLYHDHGLGEAFDNYRKYFSMNTDTEAVAYLQLASELCKEVKPGCVLVAEDMSGMPGMCLPIASGGLGFDYRLGMGTPDFWVKCLKEKRDDDWDIGALWHELTQRRPQEKVIGYCESHDQALVGDKTIMFWLADKEMYWHMGKSEPNLVIDRAIALHKMIRLVTCTCAGEGYLNFMGNEFGHPEWIDFPREGNGNSYHYARRQWSLAEDRTLKYHYLEEFDTAMIRLVKAGNLLAERSELEFCDHAAKTLAYRKGRFTFFFNFHPVNDYTAELGAPDAGSWSEAIHTNNKEFGGYRDEGERAISTEGGRCRLRIDRRSAIVLERP
ncbi:MAG: alpha amylase C-terminal domain-containing protein [Clostridiales Family XIII bacterium]|jgi:1,4-alpha-glucan branching enzyme|nr:alpha amylase C-terminal domain-containing protein [Clostridiales Family XIII bacterium]